MSRCAVLGRYTGAAEDCCKPQLLVLPKGFSGVFLLVANMIGEEESLVGERAARESVVLYLRVWLGTLNGCNCPTCAVIEGDGDGVEESRYGRSPTGSYM